VRGKGTHF